MPSPADRHDPYGRFNFLVEIDGVAVAGFTEVSGLTTETDIIEYRNGNEIGAYRKLPGITKYGNIVLKRGFTADTSLWQWRKTVIDGRAERRSGSVVLLDDGREEVFRFNFRQGWPAKWEGPLLEARGSGVAIETLEIAVESIEVAT
jgi:phage tail-like protein